MTMREQRDKLEEKNYQWNIRKEFPRGKGYNFSTDKNPSSAQQKEKKENKYTSRYVFIKINIKFKNEITDSFRKKKICHR